MATGSSAFALDEAQKTIVIIADELDFQAIEKFQADYSLGMLSLKAGAGYDSSEESHMMTMAIGRRVSVEKGTFEGIEQSGDKLKVRNYRSILEQLDSSYKNFSKQMNFLGESLKQSGIQTSYIGDNSDILMIADKSGQVDFGDTQLSYDYVELNDKIDLMLENSDLLLISYNLEESEARLETLIDVVKERGEDIILFPREVSGDVDRRLNKTIVPMLYKSQDLESGILTSESTKREGLVSNLDIMVTVLEKYGISQELAVGNIIEVEPTKENKLDTIKGILLEFLNLNIVKYVFHALIILIQICMIALFIFKKRTIGFLNFIPAFIVALSLALGVTGLSTYLIPYLFVVLVGSTLLSIYASQRASGSNVIEKIAIGTNVFIVLFLCWDKEVLYNSFIGYNNIVAAGRFYGFNNDIMGVFVGTAMILYFRASEKLVGKQKLVLLPYIALVVASHTESYGSNFGGLMTSAFMAVALIYYEYFYGKKRKFAFAGIVGLAVLAIGIIVYTGGEGSHMGEFFIRVKEYGLVEFWDMISKKAKQVVYMVTLPQWGIMILAQSVFFVSYVKKHTEKGSKERAEYIAFYGTAVFAVLLNDTGVVSFVYMMMYLVSKMILKADLKERERREVI